jgi:hypothetical protein
MPRANSILMAFLVGVLVFGAHSAFADEKKGNLNPGDFRPQVPRGLDPNQLPPQPATQPAPSPRATGPAFCSENANAAGACPSPTQPARTAATPSPPAAPPPQTDDPCSSGYGGETSCPTPAPGGAAQPGGPGPQADPTPASPTPQWPGPDPGPFIDNPVADITAQVGWWGGQATGRIDTWLANRSGSGPNTTPTPPDVSGSDVGAFGGGSSDGGGSSGSWGNDPPPLTNAPPGPISPRPAASDTPPAEPGPHYFGNTAMDWTAYGAWQAGTWWQNRQNKKSIPKYGPRRTFLRPADSGHPPTTTTERFR